jgi:hypothetical protein
MDTTPVSTLLRNQLEKRRSSLIVTLIVGFGAILSAQFGSAGESVQVTTSFDAKYASAVLHQVSRVYSSGFGLAEANRVNQDINALKADHSKAWQFTVQYRGKAESLEIRAAMDDLGMIDLDFSASPDSAPAVRAAVDSYLNSRSH